MGLVIGFLPLMGWRAAKGPTLDACDFSSVMDYNYLVFLYLATIILPALFMATSYAHIYTVIIKQVSIKNLIYLLQINIYNAHLIVRVFTADIRSSIFLFYEIEYFQN